MRAEPLTTEPPLLTFRNPANGAELGRTEPTPIATIADRVELAHEAQRSWAARPWKDRRAVLQRFWASLAREAEDWAAAIREEVGKTTAEAMIEVVVTLDAIRWTVRQGGRVLADSRIGPGWQRWLPLGPARVRSRPFGVVGMIGTWNYPLLLNVGPITQALAAGNAVVWKPSELATRSGLRLDTSLREAGFPAGLVTTLVGGPEVGRALIGSAIDKGVFTGGIANGRRVLTDLAARGIPALAELSGFDAAIIRADAPRASTAPALTWGAFHVAGQTCVAVKRAHVIGEARDWAEDLAERARSLRLGDPASSTVDVGPMISEAARERFHALIGRAVDAGACVLAGGRHREGPGWFYEPTVLLAEDEAPESVLAGAFGPVLLVRGLPDESAAVAATNASPYGLSASLWGRDRRALRALADRLDVGMVTINDAVTPSGSAAAPFGGNKASGFGRTRGAFGLREFVQPQAIHERRAGGWRPAISLDSDRILRLLAFYRWLFHPRG